MRSYMAVLFGVLLLLGGVGADGVAQILHNGDFEGTFLHEDGQEWREIGKSVPVDWAFQGVHNCGGFLIECYAAFSSPANSCLLQPNHSGGSMRPGSTSTRGVKFWRIDFSSLENVVGLRQDLTGLTPGSQYDFNGWYQIWSIMGMGPHEHPIACAWQIGYSLDGNIANAEWGEARSAEQDGWTDSEHAEQTTWRALYPTEPVRSPMVDEDGAMTLYVRIFNAWTPEGCGWGAGDLRLDDFTLVEKQNWEVWDGTPTVVLDDLWSLYE